MTIEMVDLSPSYVDTVANRGNLVRDINSKSKAAGIPGLWQIQEIIEGPRREMALTQTPVFRPRQQKLTLGAGFKPSQTEALESYAAQSGLTIVEIEAYAGVAYAAALTPAIKALRKSLAMALKVYPHQIDLNAMWGVEGRLASVEVRRFPQMNSEAAEKLLREWLALVLDSQRAARGWAIKVSPLEQVAYLTYGVPRQLPRLVPFTELALPAVDTTKWSKIPVGRSAAGSLVEIDLKAGPHTLVVGGTGSGKSVTARAIIAGALARGFEVICADPTKKMAGQKAFIPYTKGFYVKSVAETAEMLTTVYAEVRRRVDLIDQADAENWQDLPVGSVKPWLVVIDEWAGLIAVDKKPAGDPKSSEAVREALEEWNSHSNAVAMIQARVAKIAREARSAGVHLVILTQRPDTADLPGQVREQLGTVLQLVAPKRPPSRDALAMVFSGDGVAQAAEEISDLLEGRPGFALSYVDGGSVEGFQAALIEPEEVAPYLESAGVPHGVPLATGLASVPEPEQAPEPAWAPDNASTAEVDPW